MQSKDLELAVLVSASAISPLLFVPSHPLPPQKIHVIKLKNEYYKFYFFQSCYQH